MITCSFEYGGVAKLRHVVAHAIVVKDNSILLVKRAPDLPEGNKWGLPGGFLDRDETVEQGILRELKEETGWEGTIKALFRINSNPNRPKEDRQNVALEFIIAPTQQTSGLDKETSKAEWIPFEKLLSSEMFSFDHGETIDLFLKFIKNPHELPLIV